MQRKQIRFGIIGLGLMGKEFGSAVARWCHLLDDCPMPVITAICNRRSASDQKWFTDNFESDRKWFIDNFDTIELITEDYRELIESDIVDAVYCAVPHNLHEKMYVDIINAGKHLLGEKPFGIDETANRNILSAVKNHPELVIKCSSEFPYFGGAHRMVGWIKAKKYGRLMEVRSGMHHSSDLDLQKPLNWKRMISVNGEYGCMGDLGMHAHHIPLRMGWTPRSVNADLMNIAEERPDGNGNLVPCETWDNAIVTCSCIDEDNGKSFSMSLETKRMAPGQTNTWFIEVYGTDGSAKYTTHDPRSFYYLETVGKEQGWTRVDIGPNLYVPTITGGIFETGFSDVFQQMICAFMYEFRDDGSEHPFPMVSPEETAISHRIMSAALDSYKQGKRIDLH